MEEPEGTRPDCAAGVLFVDEAGDVMLVEPTYKATWEIPGGGMGHGETPREACARELREELRLDVPLGRLLVVDWAPHVQEDRVRFVFDGGVLTDEQLDAIVLEPDELTSWAFVAPDELFVMVEPRLGRRVSAALEAREAGATRYLEHGVPIEPDPA
jgi:8-oxo-dGTP diphosphatase